MCAGVQRGPDAWLMLLGEGEGQAAVTWPHWRCAAACSAAASLERLALAEISSSIIPASVAGIS